MNARTAGGDGMTSAPTGAEKPGDAAPTAAQVIPSAQSAGSSAATAFACRPKQPAHGVRWLVATAGMARTDRWPFPEVKTCIPQVPDVRGSRASTDPRAPSDLFNQPKGLSMAKIARDSLQLAMKFVPFANMPKAAQLQQLRMRETVIPGRYTLCEA